MNSCSVPRCQSTPYQGFKFFNFPLSTELRNVWNFTIKNFHPDFKINNCAQNVICSKHFTRDDFTICTHSKSVSLNEYAIPSVFENDLYFYLDIYGVFNDSEEIVEVDIDS